MSYLISIQGYYLKSDSSYYLFLSEAESSKVSLAHLLEKNTALKASAHRRFNPEEMQASAQALAQALKLLRDAGFKTDPGFGGFC